MSENQYLNNQPTTVHQAKSMPGAKFKQYIQTVERDKPVRLSVGLKPIRWGYDRCTFSEKAYIHGLTHSTSTNPSNEPIFQISADNMPSGLGSAVNAQVQVTITYYGIAYGKRQLFDTGSI